MERVGRGGGPQAIVGPDPAIQDSPGGYCAWGGTGEVGGRPTGRAQHPDKTPYPHSVK